MTWTRNFYKPIDIIKTGEDGDVQLVYDKIGRQICVIKQRSLNVLNLYKTLKEIKSRYIPEIFRLIEAEENFYVVEEYISGRTLADILEYEDFFHEDLAAQIFRQICECLQELHAQNIIHRDIKPSNIMLTRDNVVRLIDFSISRILKEDSTEDTEFLGTRGYAPPEQYGFGQTDARSDIYSLGVTIQRLLGKNYSGWLEKIIGQCTKLDPENRYQSVDELIDDFDRRHWRHKFKQMQNPPAVEEPEQELNVYDKFEEMMRQMGDLDTILEGYLEADKDSLQEHLLGQSMLKIAEDFADVMHSITDEDIETLPQDEKEAIYVELEKFRAEHLNEKKLLDEESDDDKK